MIARPTDPRPPSSPSRFAPPPPARRNRRGCLLGLLAFLLIAGLAAVYGWFGVARPYLRDVARDELSTGVAAEIRAIEPADLPLLPSGELTLTEAEIDAHLREHAGAYGPLDDLDVEISPTGLRVRFSVFGATSTYSGRPEIQDGALVVADGDLSGPAAQILGPADVAPIVESQLAALLTRSNRRPTAVSLADGALTVTTAPTAPTVSHTPTPS